MNTVSARQRTLREAPDIARISRTLQPMNEYELAPRRPQRLVLEYDNARSRIDFVHTPRGREAYFIDLPGPKIPCDCQQVSFRN